MADDSVLRDVAARIIQHHFRERRDTAGNKQQGAAATGGAPARRPLTPPAPRCTAGSVLNFMPSPKSRPASSGRPASRPPRPRPPTGPRADGALQPPAPAAPRPRTSIAGPKPLPLENSADRVNRTKSAAVQAAAAQAGEAHKQDSPPPAPLQQCSSPQAQLPAQQQQQQQRPRTAARQLQLDVRGSASTEKMGHIMRLIEQLEKQAVEEARQVGPGSTPGAEPAAEVAGAAPAVESSSPPTGAAGAAWEGTPLGPGAHPIARVLAAQPLSLGSKQMLASAATDATVVLAAQAAASSKLARRVAKLLHTPAPVDSHDSSSSLVCTAEQATPAAAAAQPQQTADASAAAPAVCAQENAPTQINAAAVASSVRTKIHQLQAAVTQKDAQLAELRKGVAALQSQHDASLRVADDRHKVALAAQKAEAEAAATRSLQFIDRVMADKDALSAKCTKLSEELANLQSEAVKQIEALKDGLARELRKQKEVWVAAERTKREAWMADQTRSIKEATIKGLEPEIQRLVDAHKAEMKRAEQRHETEMARRLAAAAVQQEEAAAALRAQWATERAAAVEAERVAAREQIKDAQGRFEVELQSLRMRLAAEHQMQLDRADAARREDQGRMQQAAHEYEQRVAALRTEWEAEKAQLARQQQCEVEAVRQQYETNQEAWRAAASERARREMESREAALRRQLAAERDEELAAVVARLEEDALAKEAMLQKQLEAGDAAAEERWRQEVSRLRTSEASLSDKCRGAEARAEAAAAKIGRLEELVHTLQKEVSGKGSSLAWLEDQLAAAKKEATSRQEAGASALAAVHAQHAAERASLEQAAAAAEAAAQRAAEEAAALRKRRVQEMGELEGRFTALLATKDRTIASLTQQLQELHTVLG